MGRHLGLASDPQILPRNHAQVQARPMADGIQPSARLAVSPVQLDLAGKPDGLECNRDFLD